MEKLYIKGTRFINGSGNEVLLHGLNVLNRRRPHLYPELTKALPWFKASGFNLIRLGIFWDAAEPEPGRIDRAYLENIKEIVRACEAQNIYVMLDMHQDLFVQKYGDGAPDWACMDEGAYHPENCTLWYEAYLSSDAIIRAADHFWANSPASDGAGLLDHYAAMWKEIARIFDDRVNVIGLEPMNEPFMGSLARESFGAATMQMMAKNPEFNLARPDLIRPEEQAEFMTLVNGRFLEWDRTVLMDFYRRIRKAVREVSDKPIITGGNIYCSTDIHSGLERLDDGLQIFAPHGYDSVVDSDRYDAFSKENVERLYAHKKEDAERLKLPALIGEWGAFPSRDFTNDLIRHMNGILEQNLWGDSYCEYHDDMPDDPNFSALRKAYPMEISGHLLSYHYDEKEQTLTLDYEAKPGESRVYLPFLPKDARDAYQIEQLSDTSCYCLIHSEEGTQHLVIK